MSKKKASNTKTSKGTNRRRPMSPISKIIPRRIVEGISEYISNGFLCGIRERNPGKFPEGTTKEKPAKILGGISAKNHKEITEVIHREFIEVAFLGILKRTCGGIPKVTSRATTGILIETSGGIIKSS